MSETLATALVEAQKNMPGVKKTGSAVYGEYATIDEIIAKTRPHLNAFGLSIIQFPEITEAGFPALRTTLTHVSGESVTSLMPLFLAKNDMQQLGSAITYARRYAWAAALGIAADHDDDGAAATNGSDGASGSTASPVTASPQAATPPESPAPSGFSPPPTVQAELDRKAAGTVPPGDGGVPEQVVMPFGKHSGSSLGDLLDKDLGYVKWLASEKFEPKNKDQRRVKGAAMTLLGEPVPAGGVEVDDSIPFAASWA